MGKLYEKYVKWWYSHLLQLWLAVVAVIAIAIGIGTVTTAEGIEILLLLTLVLVTWSYARDTRNISKSSQEAAEAATEQAKASVKMAEEMRQQRLTASQPVIWPTIWGWDSTFHCLRVNLVNVGNGPALDVDIFLGRGKEPIIKECEHKWWSYIVAGHLVFHQFLYQADPQSYDELVGEYTVLVEWRDLHGLGPFFQAKLPFSIEVDSRGILLIKEGVVNIAPIHVKRKPIE